MTKRKTKLDIETKEAALAKNRHIDPTQLDEAEKLLGELRKSGLRGPKYRLTAPHQQRLGELIQRPS